MGWASSYIEDLQKGVMVRCKPVGQSMKPRINSGDTVTIMPLAARLFSGVKLEVGDMVLCKVKGQEYLHLISAIRGKQYQISSNRGHINGWVKETNIYGVVIDVKRTGK